MKLYVHVSLLLFGLVLLPCKAADWNSTAAPGLNSTIKPTTKTSATTPKSAPATISTPAAQNLNNSSANSSSVTPPNNASSGGGNGSTSEEEGNTSDNTTAASSTPSSLATEDTPTANATAQGATNTTQNTTTVTSKSEGTSSTAAGGLSPVTDHSVPNSTITSVTSSMRQSSDSIVHQTTTTVLNISNHSSTSPEAPAMTSATITPLTSSVIISETNLLIASKNFYVELKGDTNASLDTLTLVVFDANTTGVAYHITFNSTTALNATTGLFVQAINERQVQNLVSVVVALYRPNSYKGNFTYEGLQDYAVFSLSPPAIASNVKEVLLPEDTATTVVKKGLTASSSMALSLSRCEDTPKNNSMFYVAPQSRGTANSCPLMPKSPQFTLQLHIPQKNCMPSADNTDTLKKKLEVKLFTEINRRCGCGLSVRQIHSNLTCARDLFLEFRISPSFHGQAEEFNSTFVSLVKNPNNTQMFGGQYRLVSCWQNCRNKGAHHPPGSKKDNNGNISVTVAVVLSCVAFFLLILVAVFIYMRRNRRGIMRQFRMTRLQEDDDMDDMDDFIGGGLEQEPSFSSSRNNLTS